MVKRWHEPISPPKRHCRSRSATETKCPDWLASQRPSKSPEEQQSECIIWDEGQRVRLKESGSLMCPLPSV